MLAFVATLLALRGHRAEHDAAFVPHRLPAASPAAIRPPSAAPAASASPTPSAPSPSRRRTRATPAPARAPLTVLNNSTVPGLASRAAARFRADGWPVTGIGNVTGQTPYTTVFYGPGQEAAARGLAREFPGVRSVQPRTAGLPGSGLTVVLTRGFT